MRGALVAVTVLAMSPGAARADADHASVDVVARPLVLVSGGIEARLVIEASNDAGKSLARPLTFAPDVWWGATRQLTLGLIHSNASLDRIDAGRTFCVRPGTIVGWRCEHAYRGSGIDARWSVVEGNVAVAARMRLVLRDIEPWKPAITLGALARARHGRLSVTVDPYVRFGLAHQDEGNRAALVVPLWFAIQPAAHTAVVLHAGYEADIAVARDGWRLPIGIGATRRLGDALEVALEVGFPALLGPVRELRRRNLMLAVTWRR